MDNLTTQGKKRSANMTVSEVKLLTDLCMRYKSIIENKRTDAVSVRMKKEAWQQLSDEFCAASNAGVQRDGNQLKHAYENMRARAKKLASNRAERLSTGDGSFEDQVEEVDEKVIAMLGNRSTSLISQFDDVSAANNETEMSYSHNDDSLPMAVEAGCSRIFQGQGSRFGLKGGPMRLNTRAKTKMAALQHFRQKQCGPVASNSASTSSANAHVPANSTDSFATDEDSVFATMIAYELRKIQSERIKRKLKKAVLDAVFEAQDQEEQEQQSFVSTSYVIVGGNQNDTPH